MRFIFQTFIIALYLFTFTSYVAAQGAAFVHEGTNREDYPNGRMKNLWVVEDGKKKGFYRSFYPTGDIKAEYMYKDDLKDGAQRTYFENGKIEKEWFSKAGKKHGDMKEYHLNGKVYKQLKFKNGNLHGALKVYRRSGILHKVKNYTNGKLHGAQKSYWLNGNMSTIHQYNNGKLDGDYKTFSPSGEIIQVTTYKDGEFISSTFDYYEDIELGELDYKYKGFDPEERFYDASLLRSASDYKDGLLDDLLEKYYLNGGLKSITHYIENVKDGVQLIYYDTGEMQSRLYFVEDKLEGIQEFFYKNGVLKARERFEGGLMHGLQEYYYNNGVLMARKVYQYGNLIRFQKFIYENGVFKTVEEYIDGKIEIKQAGLEIALNQLLDIEEIDGFVLPEKTKETYANGNIKLEFEVIDRKEAYQRTYYENGQLKLDIKWDGSDFIFYEEFDEAGNFLKQELESIYKQTEFIEAVGFCQLLKGKFYEDRCILPTKDAQRECFDAQQCQGHCIAFDVTVGDDVQGVCSAWSDITEECYHPIEDGKALEPAGNCL